MLRPAFLALALALHPIALAHAAGDKHTHPGAQRAAQDKTAPVPLYDNLGAFTVPISSQNPKTQQYFDQGMRLTYAFNHAEAIRSIPGRGRVTQTRRRN